MIGWGKSARWGAASGLLALAVAPVAAQCGPGTADCVGNDCLSSTSAGVGNVEYAYGNSSLNASDGKLLFGSFKEDTMSSGYRNGSTLTNTDAAFVRVGAESIRHAVWGDHKRAEISDIAIEVHPNEDAGGNPYYYWYGWSYFLPNDGKWDQTVNPRVAGENGVTQYIGQWRFSNVGGCATMTNGNNTKVGGSGHHLQYRDGHLLYTMTIRDDRFTNGVNRLRQIEFDLGPAARGVWMDFMIQAKWRSDASGVFKLWLQKNNGGYTQVVDYRGPTWFTYDVNSQCSYSAQQAKAPNWQVGMYWSNDLPPESDPRVLYSDEMRMRRTLCPDSANGEAWHKTLPVPGAVNAPALVPTISINPMEMERLPSYTTSAADTTTITSHALASGLKYTKFNGAQVGDFVETQVYAPESAAYRVKLRGVTIASGTTAMLYVNGNPVGSWNQYSATTTFAEKDYGVVPLNAGNNTFRWQITGTTGGTYSSFNLDYLMLESTFASIPAFSGSYKILNKHSGKALRPLQGSGADDAKITQFAYTSTWTNEHWALSKQTDGFYEIKNVYSQKLLRPQGGSTLDNTQIVQYTDNNWDSQRWQLIDAGCGYVKIQNKYSGKYLLPQSSGTADNVNIVQYPDTNLNSHLWQILQAP